MTDDVNELHKLHELQHPSSDDPAALDTVEQAFVARLRAPMRVDAAAFDARVMSAVRKEPAHRVNRSMRRGRRIAVTSIAVGALAAASVFVIWRGDRSAASELPAQSTVAASGSHVVMFTLVAASASRVAVAGSFNGWNTVATPLRRVGKDTWTTEIPLGAGRYVYQFVIDGTRWVPDPRAPRDAGDDFGGSNSVVTVATNESAGGSA